jgi:DNA-binding IclR family transcriptional regulator
VKSALRVFDLLEFFAEWRRPATVSEICLSLGWPQSSTSVLLRSLADSGYLDHDPRSRMYVPTARVTLATAWIQDHLYSDHSLLRLMEQVLAATGHTVMIGTRKGVQVRYLHVLQSTREHRLLARIGSLRPLFRTAAGKMLLTTLSDREVAQLLQRANALETDKALRLEPTAVKHEVAQNRAAGYALSEGTSIPGAAALAVLLPAGRDRAPMTLSLGGPVNEVLAERERLLAVLREAVEPLRRNATR